ncbi:hypothetical protein AWENTII_004506 [Aspergillus wentii]
MSTQGTIDFIYPGLENAKTWYRIDGDLKSSSSDAVPLVVLHGGPGFCHNYMLPVSDLAPSIPVIFYDQIGNGLSSHHPEKKGDKAFWSVDLFVAELENLLAHLGLSGSRFDILGHSWGGMLGAEFAIRRPAGLRKLIISNSPASVELWLESVNRLRKTLPQDVQDSLQRCEDEGRLESEEYEAATGKFMAEFGCRVNPLPDELVQSIEWATKRDTTVTSTTLGPSEFWVEGSLKDWTVLETLHKISVSVLLINGHYDEAQDSAVKPFFLGP